MSNEYPLNVCRISAECLSNICRMSVEYLTTMTDTSYVKRIYAECLSNINRMFVEYLPNVCQISDNYVRHFLCQINIRLMCRISTECLLTI